MKKSRSRSLFAAVSILAGTLVAVLAATPGRAHADNGNSNLTIFYAVPSTDGSSVTIAGLLQGSPGTSYSPEVDASDSCTDEGAQVGNVNATTDANGNAYFAQVIPNTYGQPAVLQAFGGGINGQTCYPVGPDNTAWSKALNVPLVSGAGSISGTIGVAGETRWYEIPATPDSKVTVTLSGLSDDYGLAVFGDIGAANSALSGTQSLTQLSAEFASDAFSPSAFIPSAFIPSAFIPSAFIPSAFIPSAFIPDAYSPSAFIPSAFIPSSYSPSAFIPTGFVPSAFVPAALLPSSYSGSATVPSTFVSDDVIPSAFLPSTYSSAVSRSLISYDDEGGVAQKTITVNTYQNTGNLYIAVSGRNGAVDPDVQFQLSVNNGSGSCAAGVLPIGTAPAPVAAQGLNTVIVTDTSRVSGSTNDVANMNSELQTLAARPEVHGAIVDLAGNSRVQALNAQADANPTCLYAKNLVANSVKDVIASYRATNPIKYVVIAGPDNVVPFFRHPDQTLLGNETGYAPPVANNSPSGASLGLGYVLSDNDYGASTDVSLKNDAFPVPDIALGRLVKTASEISGMIQAYLTGTTAGVLPTPTSSLVTGYDFLSHPATTVASTLAAGTGTTPSTLIEPAGLSPQDPSAWTATQLKNAVLNSGRHDIVFLAGHFSANDTLAADYATDMVTTDMDQSNVNLTNTLVFSAGCHSGYDIVNGDAVPNVTLTLDWPEEFARKQAILVGGTGYQYGDTDFTAYSEQIYADFAHQFLVGTGPVSIGQALLRAKDDYLTNTPNLTAIDQKALLEATMYGLPMTSINMPGGRVPAPSDTSLVSSTATATTNPGSSLGLQTANVTVTPQLTSNTVALKNVNDSTSVNATYLSGTSGTVVDAYQPVLPLESRNVSVAGQVLKGALFTGGTYTDTSGVVPLTGAPATDIRGVHTGFTSSVYFPEKPFSINYFDALDGHGTDATRLLVTPAQDISDPGAGATTDTRRQFGSMSFRLYYSNNTATYGSSGQDDADTPALAAAPDIGQVEAQIDPNDPTMIDVCASVGDDPAAGVQDTVVTWSDASQTSGSWQSEDLSQAGCNLADSWTNAANDSTSWGGEIPLGSISPANLRFIVQAVSGTGLVSMDDNLGTYFSLSESQDLGPTIIQDVQASASSATYGAPITVSAQLNSYNPNANVPGPGDPISGEPITFTVGTQQVTAVTGDDGMAHATLALDVAPGQYTVGAALTSPDGWSPSSATGTQPITVSQQPTLMTLAATPSPPTGDSSFTAALCAPTTAAETACGDSDAPVGARTVVFVLTTTSGPNAGKVLRTAALLTNASGQVRFDAYELPPAAYSLQAYFDGAIPGVGTLSDAFYAATTASTPLSTTVAYTSPPVLTVPASVTVVQTGSLGAVVDYAASATDPVDPRPVVSCAPAPVTLFPVGTTTVSCQATDSAGNTATASFPVTVQSPVTPQVVTFTSKAPTNATVGGTYVPMATGGGSGNPVVFSIDNSSTAGACSLSSGTVRFTAVGTCVVDANQGGGGTYTAASQVQQPIAVAKGAQAITFTSKPPTNATVGGTYVPMATGGGSGNPVVFTIDAKSTSGVCSLSKATVIFTGTGTCLVDANQAASSNYTAAPQVQQSITVAKGPTTLTASTAVQRLPILTFSATLTRTLDKAALSGQTIVFSVGAHTVCTATTNSSGVASCSVIGLALGGTFTATYAGSALYLGSSAIARL
jgi:hypothetical protein